jgi:hypothetical protein
MKPDIEVYIDELVLQGFSHHDQNKIGLDVESELIRLFSEQGFHFYFSENINISFINAGHFNLAHSAGGANVGGQVADAVYSSINTTVSKAE